MGYVIYTNMKHSQQIKSLTDDLNTAKATLQKLAGKTVVLGSQYDPNANADGILAAKIGSQSYLPSDMKQSYNASKNATVSPAPFQVTVI